jgi:hypothetical protein
MNGWSIVLDAHRGHLKAFDDQIIVVRFSTEAQA